MNRINDYIGKDVVIYAGTPMFPIGAVARVLEFDSVSTPNTVSILVLDIKGMSDASSDLFSEGWTNVPKWVDISNVKQVINYTKPTGLLFNLKQKVYAWWMYVSKRKSSMLSEG